MQTLLKLSNRIDRLNERCGRIFMVLVLIAVLISAGNAIARKLFQMSSNAFLEIQWYLFGGIFLLCAGYALKRDSHVRIDVIYGKLSERKRAWIDIFGSVLFLLPLCIILIYYSVPRFMTAWQIQEMSNDAGGLIRWPVWLLIPIGFTLLLLQGASEVIKRVAFLKGLIPYPKQKTRSEEEELIAVIKSQHSEAK
jgi:TRAP-type mannitol/chloroaromatic compound transport system permease small subunit